MWLVSEITLNSIFSQLLEKNSSKLNSLWNLPTHLKNANLSHPKSPPTPTRIHRHNLFSLLFKPTENHAMKSDLFSGERSKIKWLKRKTRDKTFSLWLYISYILYFPIFSRVSHSKSRNRKIIVLWTSLIINSFDYRKIFQCALSRAPIPVLNAIELFRGCWLILLKG